MQSEGPEKGIFLRHLGYIEGWHYFRFRTTYRVHSMGPTLQRRELMSEREKQPLAYESTSVHSHICVISRMSGL